MAKQQPILHPEIAAKLRAELLAAQQNGNFMDRIIVLEKTIALVLGVLEAS